MASKAVACAELERDSTEDDAEAAVSALAQLEAQRRAPIIDWSKLPVSDVVLKVEPPARIPESMRIRDRFQLGDDLWLVPKDWDLFKAVVPACDPPGQNRGLVSDLRAPAYSIVRTNPPSPESSQWDADQRLGLCIALSRLVRPTSIGYEYAVRIRGRLGELPFSVSPGPVRGFGARAWVSRPEEDYFRPQDLPAIRDVVAAFFANRFQPKSRLRQAFWFHEYAALTELVDIRWLFTATALESLLCTDSSQSTRHFTKRLPLLAEAVGAPPFAPKDASRMWALRSALSHGSKHGGLDAEDMRVYTAAEEVLQAALRKAVLDLEFRAVFEDASSIQARFPLDERPPRTHKCPQCGTESAL